MSKGVDDFGKRLLDACEYAGVPYSQAAIGALIGVNRQTVDFWMKGTAPRSGTLFKLATALGVDPQWLGTGIGQKPVKVSTTLHSDLAVVKNDTLQRKLSSGVSKRIKKS